MMRFLMMAGAIATSAPTPLAPSGKWIVDYETDMCVATRSFGTDPVMLVIQPATDMTSKAATLYVLVPEKGDKAVRRGRATISLQPSGKNVTVDYVSGILKSDRRGYKFATGEAVMKLVAESTGITISSGKTVFALATGQVRGVISALATCNDDLLRSWGVDPTARAVPITSPSTWFRPDQYPAEAMRAGMQGRAVLALTVAPDGKPSACRIVISAKHKELDDAACGVAMRGKFEKSTDVRDRFTVLAVRWVLPGWF